MCLSELEAITTVIRCTLSEVCACVDIIVLLYTMLYFFTYYAVESLLRSKFCWRNPSRPTVSITYLYICVLWICAKLMTLSTAMLWRVVQRYCHLPVKLITIIRIFHDGLTAESTSTESQVSRDKWLKVSRDTGSALIHDVIVKHVPF